MKALKHQRKAHGEIKLLKNIGSIVLLLLFIFNLINQMHLNKSIIHGLQYTVPYLIGSFLLYFIQWKYILSITILMIGIHTTIDGFDSSSLTGAIFFCLSYSCIKNKKYGVFLLVLTIVLLTIRSMNLNDSIPQSLTIILGYFSLYALYYFIAEKAKERPINSKIKALSKLENKLLTGMTSGLNKKQIFSNIGVSNATGYDMIKKIKEKLDAETTEQIIYNLSIYNWSKNRK